MSNVFFKKKNWWLRLSLGEQLVMIKQLSVLLRAGIPLLSSLRIIEEQSQSKSQELILKNIVTDVENGQSLAIALGRFKNIFKELTINIISVGEISGNLSSNLEHLALTLKKKQALQRKIVGASIYPLFIIVATVAITIMLIVFVFPKIIPVFKSIHYQLPWTTRWLIFISTIMQQYALWLILCALLLIIAFWLLLKVPKITYGLNNTLLSVPFIKTFIQTYNTANLCRTLGLLLVSGVSIVRSFEITSDAMENVVYKKELHAVSKALAKGENISSNLNQCPKLFPIMMSQMIAVAQTTGNVGETFSYLAQVYEEEFDELTKNLSGTIEPFLLIFMGGLVGFVAISIITPIYGITQHLTPK